MSLQAFQPSHRQKEIARTDVDVKLLQLGLDLVCGEQEMRRCEFVIVRKHQCQIFGVRAFFAIVTFLHADMRKLRLDFLFQTLKQPDAAAGPERVTTFSGGGSLVQRPSFERNKFMSHMRRIRHDQPVLASLSVACWNWHPTAPVLKQHHCHSQEQQQS